MKSTVSILLAIIQFSAFGQLSQWTQGTVIKNKLKVVTVYTKVPKTNPAFYGNPRGLMEISETLFDNNGLIVQDGCKDCVLKNKTDPDLINLTEKYQYDDGRLVQISKTGYDTCSWHFYYDTLKNRRLKIKKDKKGNRIRTEIQYQNNENKEIATYGIDFETIWLEGDSVIQIFLSRSNSTYNGSTKTKKEFGYSYGTNIDKERFTIFKSSLDLDEISKTFESLDYGHLELWNHLTTYYDNNANELKIIDETEGKPLREYKRDKNGLIQTELIHFPLYTFEHLYRYKFRN